MDFGIMIAECCEGKERFAGVLELLRQGASTGTGVLLTSVKEENGSP